MIRRVAAIALASVLLSPLRAAAQVTPPAPETLAVGEWKLAPVLEVRARGEYRHDLDNQDRGMLIERARLGVDAERGPVEARVVLQDARTFNLAAGSNFVEGPTPAAATGVYEAWAEAENGAFRPTFVRIGRQPVAWGEGRLLGVADWSAAGRSLDAIRGRIVVGDGAIEGLAAILEDPPGQGVTVPSAYGELFGVRGEWAFDPLFAAEAYVLARLAQTNPADPPTALEGTVKGQTVAGALRLWGDGRAWTWGAEGAYELGRADLVSEPREAWAAAAHLARTLEGVAWTPAVRLGLSYASGDDPRAGGAAYRAFDPLLPDMHVWHGAMDVFAWSNEEEVNARVGISPFADGTASVEYRYARLAEAGGSWRSGYLTTIGQSTAAAASADLGHEIDATLGWSPWAFVDAYAGYSALFLGDGARMILGAPAARVSHFAFAQASVKF